jgi:hypothetical protein
MDPEPRGSRTAEQIQAHPSRSVPVTDASALVASLDDVAVVGVSRRAAVILASSKTADHSAKVRLMAIRTDVRS